MEKLEIKSSIRRLRFDANEMSQQELAEQVGVTRQAIMSIESGKYYPSLELAYKIARTFGKKIEDVFSFSWDYAEKETTPTDT